MKPPLWLICALASVACAATGQILLKLGVRAAHLPADAGSRPLALAGAFLNPWVIAGVVAFALGMVFWLGAINGHQLSTVYPLASLGYVVVAIASTIVFGDRLTRWNIAGIAIIVCGVIVLNAGPRAAAPPEEPISAPSAGRGS